MANQSTMLNGQFEFRFLNPMGTRSRSHGPAAHSAITTLNMEVSTAIEVINNSDRSYNEKKHMRKLVRNGGLVPATFDAVPNFDEILGDFPVVDEIPVDFPVDDEILADFSVANWPEAAQDLLSPTIDFLDAFNAVFMHGCITARTPVNCVNLKDFLEDYLHRANTAYATLIVEAVSTHAEVDPSSTRVSVQRFIVIRSKCGLPLFGMIVAEYPQNCGSTLNAGRLYVKYIDSCSMVKLPNDTPNPYSDVVSGYLTFASLLGYKFAHIWSCPPDPIQECDHGPSYSETLGGDRLETYIFPKRGVTVKDQTSLDNWYKNVLDRGGWYYQILNSNNVPPSMLVIPAFCEYTKHSSIAEGVSLHGHVFVVHLRTTDASSAAWEVVQSGQRIETIRSRFRDMVFATEHAAAIREFMELICMPSLLHHAMPEQCMLLHCTPLERCADRRQVTERHRLYLNQLDLPYPCTFW